MTSKPTSRMRRVSLPDNSTGPDGPSSALTLDTSRGVDLREILPGMKERQPQPDPAQAAAQAEACHEPEPPNPGPAIADFDDIEWGNAISENDVVQVAEPGSRHYGQMFIVGGLRDGKVHGHYIISGRVEYITIPEPECERIGPSKVRSRRACSPRWESNQSNRQ